MRELDIATEEAALSEGIFKRLAGLPLIDKYEAYQILDDEWTRIAVDLEIIQSEGFAATKKVDPNLVTKKKDGKDVEVQDGWAGRILPFPLVQESLLKADYQKLKDAEDRLSEIEGELTELLETFSEEEKVSESFTEDKDGFVPAELAKEAKQIRADRKKGDALDEESYEARILKVDSLLAEEKSLKKDVKAREAALHLKTKATIEALTDEAAIKLLEEKWIAPLTTALHKLPEEVIAGLSAKVSALAKKYETTFKDIVDELRTTEAELSGLIDELTGSDYDLKGLAEFQQLLKGE